jgi:hypothetical protein
LSGKTRSFSVEPTPAPKPGPPDSEFDMGDVGSGNIGLAGILRRKINL